MRTIKHRQQQFKTYLSSINNINELNYIINTSKASIPEVKQAFKNMMFNSTTNQLTTQGTDIFNTIWNNNTLKNNLFDLSSYPTNLSQIQIKQLIKTDFETLVINTQSNIYNFIKAQ